MTVHGTNRQTTLQQLAPYMGMGMQLAAAMTVFGAIGWWLDGRFGTTPWLLVSGVLLGAIGGMISIIRTAIRSNPNRRKDDEAEIPGSGVGNREGSGEGSEDVQH